MKFIRSGMVIWIVFSSLLTAGMAPPEEMRCNYTARFLCNPKGCNPTPDIIPPNFLIVPQLTELRQFSSGDELPQIRRCDAKGCTPVNVFPTEVPASIRLSGIGRGYYLAVNTGDIEFLEKKRGQFMEIATLNDLVFVNYGNCPLLEEDALKDEGK